MKKLFMVLCVLIMFFGIIGCPSDDPTSTVSKSSFGSTTVVRSDTEPVSSEDPEKAKTRARANLLRALGSNQGLANQLVAYQTLFGDWKELFRQLESLEKVASEDVLRVAKQTFKDSNRTVGMIETVSQ